MSGTDFSDREINLDEQLQAQAQIWNHIYCMANSMSLKCAVELGIPDIIQGHGRPVSLSELIAEIRIPPPKAENFRRLLRLLVHNGIFSSTQRQGAEINHRNDEDEEEEIKYDLTPCSRLLVKKSRVNLAAQVLMELNPLLLSPWEHLSRWFMKEGSTPFEETNGPSLWDYAGQRDDVNRMLNEGMSSDSRLTVSALIAKCGGVFRGVKSLVDVGGGTGTTARALVQAFPDMKVTVLDLPHVVADLKAPNNENGMVGFVGGDMFDHIPPADAVFLKWILHCWSDKESVEILRECREAIPVEGGKVIIVDMVMDPTHRDEDHFKTQLFTDLMIMLHTPGKERDEQQWKKIFTEAGFSRYSITPGLGLRSVIEVFP